MRKSAAASGNTGIFYVLQKTVRRKHSAFSLAELIVVITILVVLATIGFLALSGYSQDARDALVKANVRSAYSAISSESALTGYSPRYYIVHDANAELSGAFVYVEGNQIYLSGGNWNDSGTNYTAGNPDWTKLKLNPEKFRLSSFQERFDSTFAFVKAAYDSKAVTVGAMDAVLPSAVAGRNRTTSLFQATGIVPVTGAVSIVWNFPNPTLAQIAMGAALGLVKVPNGTGALVDGGSTNNNDQTTSTPNRYPDCDSDDVYVTGATVQVWAACNVGAIHAWTGGMAITNCSGGATDCDSAIRHTLGSYFQWGRNEDVTSVSKIAWPQDAVVSATETRFITAWISPFDWLNPQNENLWGWASTSLGSGTFTGQTPENQAVMKGPCAPGYHVPTQMEWGSAISAITGTALNSTIAVQAQRDLVASVLKLPLAGNRQPSTAAYNSQGSSGYYWTSSPTWSNGHNVTISATHVSPSGSNVRGLGYSVRCLKN